MPTDVAAPRWPPPSARRGFPLLAALGRLLGASSRAVTVTGARGEGWLDGLSPMEVDAREDTSLTQAELEVLK